MKRRPFVLAIVGPTCTGKTDLSLRIAKKINAEIISCDSRNIYKFFDIGTAKVSLENQKEVQHHFIDIVEPDENYTVAQFAKTATQIILDLCQKDILPIVCGGTGLYARALLEGLVIPEVEPQFELRKELNTLAQLKGKQALHDELVKLDPVSANKLNPNDTFRIIRALEVSIFTGKPFSEQTKKIDSHFDVLWVGLTIKDRAKLKELIKKRIKIQIEMGMLSETKFLYDKYGPSQKLLKTVNYSDFVLHIEGKCSFEEAVMQAENHNYQLARRQIMWFKSNPKINWFNVDEKTMDTIELEVNSLMKNLK